MRNSFDEGSRRTNYPKFFSILLLLSFVLTVNLKAGEITLVSSSSTAKQDAQNDLRQYLDSATSYVSQLPGKRKPLIYAKQYVLLDATNAEVIVSKGQNDLIPIASTTKMTTAIVALSKLPLDKEVTISAKPPNIQGSKIGLRVGEKITIRNLIQGLLIYSGNDAAFALAEAYAQKSGDYHQFVAAMNEFAKNNHLENTVYGDPAGLDDEIGRSTPLALAHLARIFLNQPFLAQTVLTSELTISSTDGRISHSLKNTNRLIIPDSSYYLPNAIGGKTGFTLEAGHSLVAAYKWRGRILIGVVMNTTESTNTASASEMNKLFRWADNSLELNEY